MKRLSVIAWLAAMAALTFSARAETLNRAPYERMVAAHAKANQVPEALVHRIIVRESKYHPDLIGRGGTIGLMQIKLATARGVGYTGDAEGLRDPETNLTYGVKYLAGAYRAAEGDHDRAVRLYAAGYYEVAKRQRLNHREPVLASVTPKEPEPTKPAAVEPTPTVAERTAALDTTAPAEPAPEPIETPKETAKPKAVVAKPVTAKPNTGTRPAHTAKPKPLSGPLVLTPILAKLKAALTPRPAAKSGHRKLADAKQGVPRPAVGMAATPSDSANATKPR